MMLPTSTPLRLYATALRLYPRTFREAFADEMLAVFAEAFTEASGQGMLPAGLVCLNELLDLPLNLLREHLLTFVCGKPHFKSTIHLLCD